MNSILSRLASARLTLLGMVGLAVGAGLGYENPSETSDWFLAVPLLFLALNLCAAILTKPAIKRRPGLLVFHLGLLSICLLVAIGRLTLLDARIEMTQGMAFDPSVLSNIKQGPLHDRDRLAQISFVQGPYTVSYAPRLKRGPTRSHVLVPDGEGGWQEQVVGDDTPLLLGGYRFYTSFNKGFAVMVSWLPDDGQPLTGTIHMPSYPLFDYKQANSWTPPGADEVKLWLRLETGIDPESDWILDGERTEGILVVTAGDLRQELAPGDAVRLPEGEFRFEQLTTWMGYKVFYDPTLAWLFWASVIAIFGLSVHYWQKFGRRPMKVITAADKGPDGSD